MREGIYRLYRVYVGADCKPQSRQVARFVFYGDTIGAMEDHDGIIEHLAPDHHVTGNTLARLQRMEQSPYWRLVHEDDIQTGEHGDLLPEVDDAGPEAWPSKPEER